MIDESVLARIADNPKLPTPPALTLRILERANKPNCSIAEIGRVISQDPAMCGRMLKLVNSSLYGLHRPVTSIERALNLLGLNHVRSLVLSLSLPMLKFQSASSERMKVYWKSSVTIAIICRELAIRLSWPDTDSEMVAGLLCDFGVLLLQENFADQVAKMPIVPFDMPFDRQCEMEQAAFGVDHAEIGAYLLSRWRLAPDLTEPVRLHHRADEAPAEYAKRAHLLAFSSRIAQLHKPSNAAELLTEIETIAKERYRLDHATLLGFLESLNDKISEFARLIDVDLGPRESFADLFTQSTENLTRLAVEASLDNFRIHEEKTQVERNLEDAKEALRLSEQQLWQAQKMEAIGQLAGGVAHDFNNLLTVINGNSELLLENPALDADSREMLEMIRDNGRRAANLTRQLLAFSRKQRFVSDVTSLNTIVTNITKLVKRLIGEDIQLTTRLANDLADVKVDTGQIEQVIVNLAVNARDAMPNGGSVTIETFNLQVDGDVAAQNAAVVPGRYVVLSVRDAGHGIPEEALKHIFEPFFTTKAADKGTGLGLATVHGIVRQSGGHVSVSSTVGEGTVFHVYLPAAKEAGSSSAVQPIREATRQARGSETILLVDDESGVREYMSRTLARHGYKVLSAHNGHEALDVSDRYKDTIHVLITDRVMPKMSGQELIQQLKTRRPSLKVILISGYADETVASDDPNGAIAFLQKPFTPETLSGMIHDMLTNTIPAATSGGNV